MASISAVLPAQDAVALDLALDSVARSAKSGGDCRTLDQLRADALAGIGIDALRTGYLGRPSGCRCTVRPAAAAGGSHRPAASGSAGPAVRAGVGAPVSDPTCQRPTPGAESGATSTDPPALASGPRVLGAVGGEPVRVHVTVPLSTLLGGDEPGDLDGYGPIDAATARALALGGIWRRIVTDPLSGTVLDVGRRRYRPPPDLARLVRARDRTCVRPGCGVRATSCDLDHTVPFGAGPYGGATALHNLGAQCRTDHV
ncbi:DUF222 domain-containing protein, partial [Georgenia sp. 10Sc9-8]|nr:DUF222 domain-containing protein [Georgenia halotolerans]